MKGFKKDGKFIPTGNKAKSNLKKSDVRKKQTIGVKEINNVLRTKKTVEQTYSKEDVEGGMDFFHNNVGEVPQEWLQIIPESKYPLSKKTRDNLWNHNSLGYIDWDDPDGQWTNNKDVVVLTDKDRDSLIRYWIDNRKEDDLADQMERDRDENLKSTAREELSEAFGQEIGDIHGMHNAFKKFQIGGYEDNLRLTVIVPFTATLEQLKEVESKGWKVVSVGNGIELEKGGFAGKVR